MKHVLVIEFETDKPVDDLTTLVADRIYPMDCIVKPRDVVCTTLAEYLTDVRKRVDVSPLDVRRMDEVPEYLLKSWAQSEFS